MQEMAIYESQDDNYLEYLKGSFNLLKNVPVYYDKVSTVLKQWIVGSIIQEKLIFEKNGYRTPRYNELLESILLNSSELQNKKKGKHNKNFVPSHRVVRTGIT